MSLSKEAIVPAEATALWRSAPPLPRRAVPLQPEPQRAGATRADLEASIEQLEWIVNSYTLIFAVLLMTGGALGDRFGHRRVYTAGVGVFVGASAACALAPSI